ncbi:aromatic acid exporter family protein [Thalassobacillus pellis]|uniref:aromatic acid exporter family protein n=1 Tax=Thalassobacillus pellis TaxID=748008 RepID=UPI0019606088|nr:aromatic acid exporter family protein [Thalassobacillus pellis]MBM7552917.1 uncharacterized membrane protein YgaE (UPF0421/DUF939 family) [Thalassobacillus pellis]
MLNQLRSFKLFGSRTLKTGIAVFFTALICGYFDWPVIFAVITAIVTIEHTAADSIRKAAVRFPASAIGAVLATTFYGLLGKGAITFALAAMLTIAVCHRLGLNDGILVATITAIAMIPTFQEHYVVSFLIRLGTTSIGIVISTLVNFFLLPPNYFPSIHQNIPRLYSQSSALMAQILQPLISGNRRNYRSLERSYRQLTSLLEETLQLAKFQREEWKYHKHSSKEVRAIHFSQKQLTLLQQITYHLGNLRYIRTTQEDFSERELEVLKRMILSFVAILKKPGDGMPPEHIKGIQELDEMFWKWKEEHVKQETEQKHHLPPQTVLIYELLCLHEVLEELEKLYLSKFADKLSGENNPET